MVADSLHGRWHNRSILYSANPPKYTLARGHNVCMVNYSPSRLHRPSYPVKRFFLLARVLAFLRTRVSDQPAVHCPHLCLTRSHWNGFNSRLANWLGSDESENNSEA